MLHGARVPDLPDNRITGGWEAASSLQSTRPEAREAFPAAEEGAQDGQSIEGQTVSLDPLSCCRRHA